MRVGHHLWCFGHTKTMDCHTLGTKNEGGKSFYINAASKGVYKGVQRWPTL
jgi:hypothetical protein